MRRFTLLALPLAFLAASCGSPTPEADGFPQTISALSGPGGYFDTDNLISNESSYLHAVSDLRAAGVHGGAYLGVGPGQNFSYIAEIDPEIAIIMDVRRDNVLQHLIYKALFETSPTRAEYLAALTGRPAPPDPAALADAPIEAIIEFIEGAIPDEASEQAARTRVLERIRGYGFTLAPGDIETIERFHGEFIQFGLGLRFRSHGRAPQFYYPTLKELVLEVDRSGEKVGYLSSTERYETVRRLQKLADGHRDMIHRAHVHTSNHHRGLLQDQVTELQEVGTVLAAILSETEELLIKTSPGDLAVLQARDLELRNLAGHLNKLQGARIQSGASKTRLSILYYSILGNALMISKQNMRLLEIFNRSFGQITDETEFDLD